MGRKHIVEHGHSRPQVIRREVAVAHRVPVTNLIRASEADAPDLLASTCGQSRLRQGSLGATVALSGPDGRRRDTRRQASLDHPGGQPPYSGSALITVMKSADLGNRNDAPDRWRMHFSRIGAVVVKGLMRAGVVVVREITAQQMRRCRSLITMT